MSLVVPNVKYNGFHLVQFVKPDSLVPPVPGADHL